MLKATHWGFGDSDFYFRSQREQRFDEGWFANVASADETNLENEQKLLNWKCLYSVKRP